MHQRSQEFYDIFIRSILDYHLWDDTEAELHNPYAPDSLNALLYHKNWIDTVQWHLEDIIRDPEIDGLRGLSIKRRIDSLNQRRTDTVEHIDDHFAELYKNIAPRTDARHNTESLGWAIDRLSILALKEYHLDQELVRSDAHAHHINNCQARKKVLTAQKEDLFLSINWLMEDLASGVRTYKVYKQLKMYNDAAFNPVLYRSRAVIP